jgi:hypothetical protein
MLERTAGVISRQSNTNIDQAKHLTQKFLPGLKRWREKRKMI